MAYSEHPAFIEVPNADDRLWRYMDLPRFIAMLQSNALHFARLDQMSDPWEAAFGPANVVARPAVYGDDWPQIAGPLGQFSDLTRSHVHINCWHLGDVESALMWQVYGGQGRGIGVTTTWGRLTASITSGREVHGGKVNYVDYAATYIPESNLFSPAMYKRRSFQDEREVRLATLTGVQGVKPGGKDGETVMLGPEDAAVPISVDLSKMVESAVIAPDAPTWIVDVVRGVTELYGLGFPVCESVLSGRP